jgi:hypothetical protein
MTFKVTGHRIDVEGLVSDPHRTPTQLDRFPFFAHHQFIMLEALDCLLRSRRLDRILINRRPAGLNAATKTLAQYAGPSIFTVPAYGFVMALYLDWLRRTVTEQRKFFTLFVNSETWTQKFVCRA